MTTRPVLTDGMWGRLEPLLPDRMPRTCPVFTGPSRGRPWQAGRVVIRSDVTARELARAGGSRCRFE
jgi:hypothetical protein